MTLMDACREVMSNPEMKNRYPEGLDSTDILVEIRRKYGVEAFPFVTVLDVANEMSLFFGPGRSPSN